MAYKHPFPYRLHTLRKMRKISQKELGIRIGLEPGSSSSRMNHYEKGRHTPDFSIIKLLADELKVPAYYFFCDSDEEAERALRLYALSDEQLEIIDKMLLEFTQK